MDERQLRRNNSRTNGDSVALPLDHAEMTEEGLSNSLVLKNIISQLDNTDIESCCQVNKFWNSIADPLFVRYYEVTLEQGVDWDTDTFYPFARISKPSTYDKIGVNRFRKGLKDATEFLEAAAQTQKVAIHFRMTTYTEDEEDDDEDDEDVVNFLTKFGILAGKLSISGGYMSTRRISEIVVGFFPNLHVLDVSKTYIDDPELRDGHDSVVQSWKNILRMSHNLKEIRGFPICRVDALIGSEKALCVRSLNNSDVNDEGDFRILLEKVASLELRLTSFNFYFDGERQRHFCSAELEPFVRRILVSSRDSLEHLVLYNTGNFDFRAISPMSALKTIDFKLTSPKVHWPSQFFSSEIILSNLFPKVTNLEILGPLHKQPVSRLASCFPEAQFAPWGIRKLRFEDTDMGMSPETFQVLRRAFPALTDIDRGNSHPGCYQLFSAISDCWPEIELLSLRFAVGGIITSVEGQMLECTSSGIPYQHLNSNGGTDPSVWDTRFSSEVLECWKERSPLRKFSTLHLFDIGEFPELKVLQFDLTNRSIREVQVFEMVSALTLVSKQFCSRCLPELKIVVRLCQNDDSERWQRVLDMKARLEPLGNFKLETA